MRLYASAGRAFAAAQRRGEVGLTGPGQVCGPVALTRGDIVDGYAYFTWDGRYLVPGGGHLTSDQVAETYGVPPPIPRRK